MLNPECILGDKPFGLTRLRVGDRVRFIDPIECHDPRKRRPAGELGTVTAIYPLDDDEYRVDLDTGDVVLAPVTALNTIEVLPRERTREVSYSPFEPATVRSVPLSDPDEGDVDG